MSEQLKPEQERPESPERRKKDRYAKKVPNNLKDLKPKTFLVYDGKLVTFVDYAPKEKIGGVSREAVGGIDQVYIWTDSKSKSDDGKDHLTATRMPVSLTDGKLRLARPDEVPEKDRRRGSIAAEQEEPIIIVVKR